MSHTHEASTLASDDHLALISCFVPGLPQTLLVQLLALPLGRTRHSLFAAYREAGTTFELICGFECDVVDGEALDVLLSRFVRGPEFELAVLRPLREQVNRHFMRRDPRR